MVTAAQFAFRASQSESLDQAEAVLRELASVFWGDVSASVPSFSGPIHSRFKEEPAPNAEAKYVALLEQIPAVVFMAYLDQGIGEAYVSPEIEASLGYSQEEWLEDPVRWYERIHPDDKQRWSLEAAEMFLSGKPLRSAYRVIARDQHVVWFQCDARMKRHEDGRPWFIHGIAFDISDLKHTEKQLEGERNVAAAILNTVGALVVVLDRSGQIVRFNRACEQATGYSFEDVKGKPMWDLFESPGEIQHFRTAFEQSLCGEGKETQFESYWITRSGASRLVAWSTTLLPTVGEDATYVIASGMDITERKHLEKTILEISAREQRRIAQDLHDGLGQHLTGIAFMAKVQEHNLAEKRMAEAADAAKIVRLVNDAISRTRELSRGLLPVVSEAQGLIAALQVLAAEIEDLFAVSCNFHCADRVLIPDETMATHLYHVAQEAVTNAIKHGHSKKIIIELSADERLGILAIHDNGIGIMDRPSRGTGMGLHIMKYRADMIRGELQIRRGESGGTVVTCRFPLERGSNERCAR